MSSVPIATSFLQSESFIYVLYIIAFALFIQGLRGLAGPTTAVRGDVLHADYGPLGNISFRLV